MSSVDHAWNIDALREAARQRLPRGIFDFFDGGAEDEITLRDNRDAWSRLRFSPHVLRDVSKIDLSCEILGGPSCLPLVIAPTGGIGIGWPGADVAIARAAMLAGIPYTLSTTATASIEAIAKANGSGRRWFQLYILHDQDFTDRLAERAWAAGFEALVLTVDLPVGGKRERDNRNRFTQPYRPGLAQILQACTKLHWAWGIVRHGGFPALENIVGLGAAKTDHFQSQASSVGQQLDPAFDERGFARMRARWPGKLIVKGVARADDAERLLGLGADAVWISNHGGRQLDGAPATVDVLSDIVQAVAGRVPVMIDGGVRRGSAMVKARALGAQCVCAGRPTLYGASAAGLAGAQRALDILTDELYRTMQLVGARNMQEITPDLIDSRTLPRAR